MLGSLKENAWKAMNSYTHGGIQQAIRRTSGAYIEPDFSDEEIEEVIKVSGSFAILAFQRIVIETGREDLVLESKKMLGELGAEAK